MTQPPVRYKNVAQHLQKLPPEVVHEILGDLSILKLLEIVGGHDIPYIDQCILSHKELGKVFLPEALAEAKTYFIVYLQLCSLDYRSPRPKLTELDIDAVRLYADHPNDPATFIVSIVQAAVLKHLKRYEGYLQVLRAYAPLPIPDPSFWTPTSASDLKQIFETIDAAEAKINGKKAEQLERMARLIQEYPRFLKRTNDDSQEPRRNEQHIVESLLAMAQRMRRRQFLSGRIVGKSVFSSRAPHVAPYDRLLRLVLKTLKKCPPNTAENASSTSKLSSGGVHHVYPAELEIVAKGRQFIYPRTGSTRDESEPQERTLHTPYSDQSHRRPGGFHQPTFWRDLDALRTRLLPLEDTIIPAADEEIEWLEAFLKICNHMSTMEEEWKKGQTIAEYWRLHLT